LYQLVEKAYGNPSVYGAVRSITSDPQLTNDAFKKLRLVYATTPYSKSINHLTVIGTFLESPNNPNEDLIFNFNQTSKLSTNYLSETHFINGKTVPIFTRHNDLITINECSISTLNANLSFYDSRLIYEREKLFKIDYIAYCMNRCNYLRRGANLYSKDGFLVDDHFNEILSKISKDGLGAKFNVLSNFEKKCFSAMLIGEVEPNLLNVLDLYDINKFINTDSNF